MIFFQIKGQVIQREGPQARGSAYSLRENFKGLRLWKYWAILRTFCVRLGVLYSRRTGLASRSQLDSPGIGRQEPSCPRTAHSGLAAC